MSADNVTGQTTTAGLAPYAADYVADLLGQTKAVTGADYVPYTGDRIAAYDPLQTQAYNAASTLAPSGYLTKAGDLADYFGTTLKNASAYSPSQFNVDKVTGATVGAAPTISASQGQAATLGGAPTAQAAQFTGPKDVTAATVNNQRVNAPSLRNLSMQAAQGNYNPNLQTFQMGAPQEVRGQTITPTGIQAALSNYDPASGLQQYQMGPSERVSTDKFTAPGTAQEYMSPYIQNVLDIQKREALRADDIARQQRGARAAKSGAYGGARQAIEEAEANRNLQTRMSDIEATGLQSAFQAAQQQFTSDQARALQAAQANQGAGLTVGQQNLAAQLGVQGLGTQAGMQLRLANLSNEQQAAVQNAANQLQASGMSAQQALQAALANQQAGLTTGQQNLGAQLQTQALGANIGSQMAQANLANQQQANAQNLSAALQTQGLGAQTGMQAQQLNQAANMQAQLANQQAGLQAGQFNAQMGYNTGLQNAQMQQQANLANMQMAGQYGMTGAQLANQMAMSNAQLGTQAGIAGAQLQGQNQALQANLNQQANLANQQYGLQSQSLQEQANQFGANLGLQQIGMGLNAAGQLGNLGAQQFGQNVGAINLQNQLGTQGQQYDQATLNQQYQDFINQRDYPLQMLNAASNIYSRYPMGSSSTNYQYQDPSMLSQIGGLLGTAYMANRMFGPTGSTVANGTGWYPGFMNMASGGEVKQPRSAGLADLMISKLG